MKFHRGAEVWLHAFLISTADGSGWLVSCWGQFTLTIRQSAFYMKGGWHPDRSECASGEAKPPPSMWNMVVQTVNSRLDTSPTMILGNINLGIYN
jgi:hypothetical protein